MAEESACYLYSRYLRTPEAQRFTYLGGAVKGGPVSTGRASCDVNANVAQRFCHFLPRGLLKDGPVVKVLMKRIKMFLGFQLC